MKRIIFGLMLAMMFCTLVQGANRTVTENDGQGNKKRGEPTTAVWTGTGSTSGARPRKP